MSLSDCRRIALPRINDPRGNLTFLEGGRHVPFEIRRIYYLYDVPAGAARGGHAHRELEQVFIALGGGFDLLLDDGRGEKASYRLDSPSDALYVAPGLWRDLSNFSPGATCMVLASLPYDEADYIRDYATFLEAVRTDRMTSARPAPSR